MARMSQYSFSANQRSLRNAWDRNGMIVGARGLGGSQADGDRPVPEHHQWQVQGQPRQRAAEGSQTKINSSPSTTQPGTISPTQPQRTPGVRNFSLFGGAYTWSSKQAAVDERNPDFNRQTGDVLRQPAAKPAVTSATKSATAPVVTASQPSGISDSEEDWDKFAAELMSVGAGSTAFSGATSRAAAALTRTGNPAVVAESIRAMRDTAFRYGLEGKRAAPETPIAVQEAPLPEWNGTPEGVDVSFPDVDMSPYQTATRQERTNNERLFNTGLDEWMKRSIPGFNYTGYTGVR